jgi:dTDP-4-amino-4,6-dideoxygalactose transaminase
VTTNDEDIASRIRMIRDHGQAQKYYHDIEGYNGRLDAIQAGILQAKLGLLPTWNEQRREAAARYSQLLADREEVTIPYESPTSKPVYHLYVVQVNDLEGLRKHLAGAGIGTGIHYPVPLHLQKAYSRLGYKQGDFPVTERVSRRILSLPMFPQLAPQEQQQVADEILRFVALGAHESVA